MSTEATGFLYPFIEADERDAPLLLETMARSAAAKLEESRSLRRSVVVQYRDELDRAGAAMAQRLAGGGRLFALGNGGSATDAEGLVALCSDPPVGDPTAALSLTAEAAVLTALANDVGFESVFSRQVIAYARPEDCLIGFSTSGDSPNVLRAFDEASARGLLTVGFAGNEGGAMAVLSALSTTAWWCRQTACTASRRPRTRWFWPCGKRWPGSLGDRPTRKRRTGHDRCHPYRCCTQSRGGGIRADRGVPAAEAPAGRRGRDPGPRGRGQGVGRSARSGVPARLRQRGAAGPRRTPPS